MIDKCNILVLGKMRVGKGEFTKILCQKYGYTNYSMADWLKKTVNLHYNLINPQKGDLITLPNKTITYREVLQGFGENVRKFDNSWHIRETMNNINSNNKFPFIIDDVRYYNEIELLKEKYPNTITIRLTCNENIRIQRICLTDSLAPNDKINKHISETELDGYIPDYMIDNSGSIYELEYNIKNIEKGFMNVNKR